jgi:hypothetical protein
VYTEAVSIILGERLLGDDLVLRCEGGAIETVAKACSKVLMERKEVAAACASAWNRESGGEVLLPDDPEVLLKAQLIMEFLQALGILESSACLTPMLRRALSAYFTVCREINNRWGLPDREINNRWDLT